MDALTFIENRPTQTPISILPVPIDSGGRSSDVLSAPRYLLGSGLQDALNAAGLRAQVLPQASTLASVRDVAAKEIWRGNKVLALGGDHAIAVGSISGASQALQGELGVIWIDVHGDLHTPETSISKCVHGMATTALMGLGTGALRPIVSRPIASKNFLYLGLRHLEQAEIDFIRAHELAHVTMMEFDERGLRPAYGAIDALREKMGKVWVSLDIDAIDESVAPASAMAGPGGFTYREITNLMSYIGKTCDVVGLDLVEITPSKDSEGKTAKLALELAAAAFGAIHNDYVAEIRSYLESPFKTIEKQRFSAPVPQMNRSIDQKI